METKKLTVDFETRGSSELKKEGAWKYSLHFLTRPTCLSIRSKAGEVFFNYEQISDRWTFRSPSFRKWWFEEIQKGTLFVAHNAGFEIAIYNNYLVARKSWPEIPLEQWRCTAAKAAACALPRSLAGAGEALKLVIQKDWRGHAAVMATCKPTKEFKAFLKKESTGHFWTPGIEYTPPPMFLEPDQAPEVFNTLYEYCKIDTATEELLDRTLPDLIPQEQEIWFLNQKMNSRGFYVDLPLIKTITKIMQAESKTKLAELDKLTLGMITKPGARQSILDFLESDGIELPDIQAKTVDDVLKSGKLTEDGRAILQIRKALSKTSTKKYEGFLDRVCPDGRIRDILLYHGGHTGRDSGTGIQIQNFPKPLIDQDSIDYIIEHLHENDHGTAEWIKTLHGDLGGVFASLLRSTILATPGKELFVGDLSLIEVCVLWWLADNTPGLEVLNSGKDPYIYQAAANLNVKYEDIEKDSPDRQLGKMQVLGCGFQMAWRRFQKTAWMFYRLELSDEQSKFAVSSYRKANEAVVDLWDNFEDAAVLAVKMPGKVFEAGKCRFSLRDNFLWVKLPSGRKIAYREPQITMRETEYGTDRKTLEYWAINPKTKKWCLQPTFGGKLTENIVQGVARDILYSPLPKLERMGYQTLFLVHDETVSEREKGKGSLDEFLKVICERPKWVDDKLPISAKGFVSDRYRK